MAAGQPYEHEFKSVQEAVEYLKAALKDSDAAFTTAVQKVMAHGPPRDREQWKPCSHLPGYEQRQNEHGHLEIRPIQAYKEW